MKIKKKIKLNKKMKIMKIIEIINNILLFMGNNKYNFVLFSILIVLFYIDVSCNILDN